MTTIPDYPFRGVPLSPSACLQVVTTWVLGDEPMSRQAIIARVEELHSEHGGTLKDGKHLLSALKKALNEGRSKGHLTSPRTGYYRRVAHPVQAVAAEELGAPGRGFDAAVGTGTEAVYVYYLPAYRKLADTTGEASWPCKVGRSTAIRAAARIKEQFEQAPERPHLALLLCTEDAGRLERHLHSTLDAKGLRLTEAQGGEWFQTSPKEVLLLAHETRWLDA